MKCTSPSPFCECSNCFAAKHGRSHSRPVLFLDVDGVLNVCGKSNQGLLPEKCDLLARVCHETGCQIVVSSTWWKFDHLMGRLFEMFGSRGITCVGKTPVFDRKTGSESTLYVAQPRNLEITAWLVSHPEVSRYAIVDDDKDADDGTGRYVQTGSFEGLMEHHVQTLIQMLTK